MPNYFFKKPREIKFTQILIPAKFNTFKVAIDLSDWLDIKNAYSVYCFILDRSKSLFPEIVF